MDAGAWVALSAVIVVTTVTIALAPRWHAQHRARQDNGRTGGGLSGIGAGFDAVWRPSADEARHDWEAQIEAPAPTPNSGDLDRLDEGRIIITTPRSGG